MEFGWVLLAFLGIVIALTFLHVLTRMASEREARTRARRAGMSSSSGDAITYAGHS